MIKVVNCIPQLWNTDVLEIKLDEVDALFACSCLKFVTLLKWSLSGWHI